jgi:putative phosphoribosyl transferase
MFASNIIFRDRRDAGRHLGARLVAFAGEHPLVIALPRGGVPVGFEVARALGAPLEVLVVRKLGSSSNPEYGVGAIAEGGITVLDGASVRAAGMTQKQLEATAASETLELERRVERYRGGRALPELRGRTVIVVDDGIATGLSDLAAVRALRAAGVARIVVAVPVGAGDSLALIRREAEEVICLSTPAKLYGVGHWYHDFEPTSDEEVLFLLRGVD